MLGHENRVTGQDPYVEDTLSLIASNKVEGTKVYGADGKRIGAVQRLLGTLVHTGDVRAQEILVRWRTQAMGDWKDYP